MIRRYAFIIYIKCCQNNLRRNFIFFDIFIIEIIESIYTSLISLQITVPSINVPITVISTSRTTQIASNTSTISPVIVVLMTIISMISPIIVVLLTISIAIVSLIPVIIVIIVSCSATKTQINTCPAKKYDIFKSIA